MQAGSNAARIVLSSFLDLKPTSGRRTAGLQKILVYRGKMASLFPKIRIVQLASEWGSKHGGVSTFNREFSIQLAKLPDVQIFVFLPRCNEEDQRDAQANNVTLIQAQRRTGFDNETDWLCFPPHNLYFDFVIGHGVVLGRQAQIIRENHQCKWIQFVHTDPEELGMFKDYSGAIPRGEKKRRDEVELCVKADFVVAVGPKLAEAYQSCLRYCGKDQDVFVFTPGIFSEFLDVAQGTRDGNNCRVLTFGRGDAEDFSLKGYDIAASAVAKLNFAQLIFVGAYDKQQDNVANSLKLCDITPNQLRVRTFVESRESLKQLFPEADLAIMPSRSDGFGLAALEAMSASLPVLVSANSGFGEALAKVPFGSGCVISSEDALDWAKEIEKVWTKDRETRLQECQTLKNSYAWKYSWEEQSRALVAKMRSIRSDASVPSLRRSSFCSSATTVHTDAPTRASKRLSGSFDGQQQSKQPRTMSEETEVVIKDGFVSDEELEELSERIGNSWEKLARRLTFNKAEIVGFHKNNEEYAKKALSMLEKWKEKYGSGATYKVLCEALCHRLVCRKDLAEEFCTIRRAVKD